MYVMAETRPPMEAWRPFFPCWAAAGLAVLGMWWGALFGHVPSAPPAVHGTLMIWGVYGSAVLGFLWTAYPRQNQAAPPSTAVLLTLLVLQLVFLAALLAGWSLGAPLDQPLKLVAGASGVAVWGFSLVRVCVIARGSLARGFDGTSAGIPVTLGLGLLGLVLALAGVRHGTLLGLYGFLLPVALLLLDRVLPFFTREATGAEAVRRPDFWWALLLLSMARVVTDGMGGGPAASAMLLVLVVRQWSGWAPRAGTKVPLVAVLHAGLAWIVLGLGMDAATAVAPELTGLARHTLLVGGLGSLLFGLSVRVSRGHSGVGLRLGWNGAVMFGLVQLAALSRGLGPALGFGPELVWTLPSVCLLAAWVVWLATLGPLSFRGRT